MQLIHLIFVHTNGYGFLIQPEVTEKFVNIAEKEKEMTDTNMTPSKARHIIEVYETSDADIVFTEDAEEYLNAKGFLAGDAYRKGKASVFKRLKREFRACKRNKIGDGFCCQCAELFFGALAKYEKESND